MKKHIHSILYFGVFLLIFPHAAHAQRDNVWLLGTDIANTIERDQLLNFTNIKPDTLSHYSDMCILYGFNICDTNGQLLYYSNGVYIANRNNDSLYNTREFNPGYFTDTFYGGFGTLAQQSVLFIPCPGNPSLYYVFSTGSANIYINGTDYNVSNHVNISIIDAQLDNGLGGIISGKKAMPLGNDTILNCLTAVKHADGKSWWLVEHGFYNNLFIEWLITGDTILGPFKQYIGGIIHEPYEAQIVFSKDGQKLCTIQGPNGDNTTDNSADLYSFNRCTGEISNWRHIPELANPSSDYVRGCSFSSSGHYLYVCDDVNVFQFDATATNPELTEAVVAAWDSTYNPYPTYFNLMQLAPDNKIYICTWGGDESMHYINAPDSAGINCHVIQNGLQFKGLNAGGSIPQFPFYNLGPNSTYIASAGVSRHIYKGDTTQLGIIPLQGCSYIWRPVQNIDAPASPQPHVWPDTTTTYILTVSDTTSITPACTQTYTVTVNVSTRPDTIPPIPPMIIPTLITNSTRNWNIINKPAIISAELYDMVGRKLFYTQNYDNNFDMRQLANGIYIYILRAPSGIQWTGKLEVMK